MPTKLRAEDGTVHFSSLKHMARSPAHYRESIINPIKATPAMLMGTLVHVHLLGSRPTAKPIVVYEAPRTGNAWKEYKLEHEGSEIVTVDEWDHSRRVADAVLADPVARDVLQVGRYEVPFAWEQNGIECSTSGVDVIGPGFIADLKVTTNTEPETFQRHCMKMLWHAQLPFYQAAARANGITVDAALIVGVEIKSPFAVTVLELEHDVIELGEKCNVSWLERLRICEQNDHWPAYSQTRVKWNLPDWATELDFGEEEAA